MDGVPIPIPTLDLKNQRVISALGRGAKGVVFLVRSTESPKEEFLALKVVSKTVMEEDEHRTDRRIHLEKEILSTLQHPLLPRLRGVVETERIYGYAIDYCSGGDLHSLRKKQTEKMFSDNIIRFYAAELVLALEYLHGLGFVYRDLKPENVMIQENGHLMLIDFDLSTKLPVKPKPKPKPEPEQSIRPVPENKQKKKRRLFRFKKYRNSCITPEDDSATAQELTSIATTAKSNSFVGTEEYIAPEIIKGNGHDFAVDWWCLGIVLYEMLYGRTPFKGNNRKDTFYRILHRSPCLVGETTSLRDLIGKLLEKDPRERLGIEEIKRHDFFEGVDWELIGDIPRPPYLPVMIGEEAMKGNGEIDVEIFVQRVIEMEVNDNEIKTQGLIQAYEPNSFHLF